MQRSFLYTGKVGSGMTLASVIHLVFMNKINPKVNIVSNIHLKELPYKDLDKTKLHEYYDSIILFDGSFSLSPDSREYNYEQHYREVNYIFNFLDNLRKNDNIFITNTSMLQYIVPKIRNKLLEIGTLCSYCYYNQEEDSLAVKNEYSSVLVKKVSRFFKYYETREIPVNIISNLLKENR